MNERQFTELEMLVTREQLLVKGFREKGKTMTKIWRDYEIKYLEVADRRYALDSMIHIRNKQIGTYDDS